MGDTFCKLFSLCVCYRQQDSQEFLRYLLEGLHEDVNLIQEKPKPITLDDEKLESKRYFQLLIGRPRGLGSSSVGSVLARDACLGWA